MDTLKLIESIITILGITVGGSWAFWKFVVHKEAHPRIEFSVDVNFVGKQGDEWMIEVLGELENKGTVPHKMTDLKFNLKYLKADDHAEENANYGGQIDIKHELKDGSWLPSIEGIYSRLYPGITMRYNFIYKVPADASFVLIHGLLLYGKSDEQTRADRLVKVPG